MSGLHKIAAVVDNDPEILASGIELAHHLAASSFKFPIIYMTELDNPMVESQAVAVIKKAVGAN